MTQVKEDRPIVKALYKYIYIYKEDLYFPRRFSITFRMASRVDRPPQSRPQPVFMMPHPRKMSMQLKTTAEATWVRLLSDCWKSLQAPRVCTHLLFFSKEVKIQEKHNIKCHLQLTSSQEAK